MRNIYEEIIKDKKNIIKVFVAIFTLLSLIFGIVSRVNVRENKWYYSKREVALYAYKYDKRPSNFIPKEDIRNNYNLVLEGFNAGGDAFQYKGPITSKTKYTNLIECDIY